MTTLLTAEARAEISRRNGRKSHGPTSEGGKAISSRNALTHGLRSEVLALPNEDGAALEALSDAWHDHYRAASPGETELVDRAVRAIVQRRRCDRALHATLSERVRTAETRWDADQEDRLDALVARLPADPAAALRDLCRFGLGCRWLIGRWEHALGRLDAAGHWTTEECDEVIRLLGRRPEPEFLKADPDAWTTRFFNALCRDDHDPDHRVVEWLCHPSRMPEARHGEFAADFYPDPDDCRTSLREMIAGRLLELQRLEAHWRETREEAARVEAGDRALVLDDPDASLWLRYERMHDSAFHRSYSALMKGRKDAPNEPEDQAEAEPVAPNEPEVEAEPVAPNEPEAEAEPVAPNEPEPTPGRVRQVRADAPNEAPAGAQDPGSAADRGWDGASTGGDGVSFKR